MCNINGIIFGINNLSQKEISKKEIIEIGSLDVNGSYRSFLSTWKPNKYIGVDIF